MVGVEEPALKEVKGLEEEGAGLMNLGMAARVDPGVVTRVALKDDVVGGVDTRDGLDDVKVEGLFDTFGDGTRG